MDDDATLQWAGSAGEPEGEVVFEGAHADMTWQVRAHSDQARLVSRLYLHRGAKLLDVSGIGGPPLPPGGLITGSRGYTDHAPANVLVRAHPDVIAVVVTTERGTRVPMALSGVVQPWGLCFAVAILDPGETTAGLSVYTADGLYDEAATPAPPTPLPDASGWAPL